GFFAVLAHYEAIDAFGLENSAGVLAAIGCENAHAGHGEPVDDLLAFPVSRHQHYDLTRAHEECTQVLDRAVDRITRGERFTDEAERARIERPIASVVGRHHANRDVPRGKVGLHPVEHTPALHVGEEDIERDDRWLVLADHGKRGR